MKDASSRRRQTAKMGKSKDGKGVEPLNQNGHHGRSQKGCFGNHVKSLEIEKEN